MMEEGGERWNDEEVLVSWGRVDRQGAVSGRGEGSADGRERERKESERGSW